jgi:serine protease AprX
VTNPDATTEDDLYGHGTHVAGLIAGNGSLRAPGDPLRGQYLGTAPRANLVSVKVSDDAGDTSLIDVIYGVQFAVDHQSQYGIRVINLSLTSASPESASTDPLDAAVESAWLHGIVVVAAAGNHGAAADAVDYAPGNDPYVITVGAVDDQATKRTSDDALADWSSRGVTQDGAAKPDVVAPGAHMVAPYAPGSAFGTLCPTCIVDGQYFKVGGTSMSAAVVSGIVADLLELHPSWTPDQVKGALVNNVRKVAGTPGETDAQTASKANKKDLVANVGLMPNTLIDPATGDIDYTRASWSRASWSQVEGNRASWSRASWSRASWSRASWSCDCALAVTGEADPTRASWSRASWSRASWSRASWSASFSK